MFSECLVSVCKHFLLRFCVCRSQNRNFGRSLEDDLGAEDCYHNHAGKMLWGWRGMGNKLKYYVSNFVAVSMPLQWMICLWLLCVVAVTTGQDIKHYAARGMLWQPILPCLNLAKLRTLWCNDTSWLPWHFFFLSRTSGSTTNEVKIYFKAFCKLQYA